MWTQGGKNGVRKVFCVLCFFFLEKYLKTGFIRDPIWLNIIYSAKEFLFSSKLSWMKRLCSSKATLKLWVQNLFKNTESMSTVCECLRHCCEFLIRVWWVCGCFQLHRHPLDMHLKIMWKHIYLVAEWGNDQRLSHVLYCYIWESLVPLLIY